MLDEARAAEAAKKARKGKKGKKGKKKEAGKEDKGKKDAKGGKSKKPTKTPVVGDHSVMANSQPHSVASSFAAVPRAYECCALHASTLRCAWHGVLSIRPCTHHDVCSKRRGQAS